MAKSPDANIIEHVWAQMVREYSNQPRCESTADLKERLTDIWKLIPQKDIQNLFDSIPQRFQAIVKANGKMTNF